MSAPSAVPVVGNFLHAAGQLGVLLLTALNTRKTDSLLHRVKDLQGTDPLARE